jgi:trans-aconitate 2-methyltransferase
MADWDPELYNRFQSYRAEPVDWILARLPLEPADSVVDFGCGTGENTIELARRVISGHTTGIDLSPAMIARAEKIRAPLEPALRDRVHFVADDFRTIAAERAWSVVFSNAAMQWAANHRDLLTRWFRALKPGGRMVVQAPSNHEETAQAALGALAADLAWRDSLGDLQSPSHGVDTPENYRTQLEAIGFVEVDCYYHQFNHPMESPAAIVEFCRATALRPFLERLPNERHREFIEEFTRRLEAAYGTCGPLNFPFRRLFLWARRPF